MKKFIYSFIVFPLLLNSQTWFQLSDFPSSKRDDGVAVVSGNTAYFGSGLQEWNNTIDFYALNLSTFTWSTIATMPNTTERQYACAFKGPASFYVFGGDNNGALNSLYRYDAILGTWTAMASKPGGGLNGAACLPFGDKVIIAGGKFSTGQVSDEVWEYAISTNTWLQKNNFTPGGRWRASAGVLNNFGYLVFGKDNAGLYRRELYKYDPAADTWTKISDFPEAQGRAYAAMQAANNKLMVFGGQDTTELFYKDCWYFEPTGATWLQGPDLPAAARKGGMSCVSGNQFFYSCGIGTGIGRLTETWMMDIPVGISENKNSEFTVYPNPAVDELTIQFSDHSAAYVFTISDLSGKLHLRASNVTTLDFSGLSEGLYILEVKKMDGGLVSRSKIARVASQR